MARTICVADPLEAALRIEGALGIALLDVESGACLKRYGPDAPSPDLDSAAAGGVEVVRAKLHALEMAGIDDEIEDVLITLGRRVHVLRILRTGERRTLCLHLALDRDRATLGAARVQLCEIAKSLDF